MKRFVLLIMVLFFISGCAGLQLNDTQDLIVEQTIDTFGYTLGLFAVKDDIFKEQVEMYYTRVKSEGITTAVANEILFKFKDTDIAYQVLAYKMVSLIKLMGGQIAPDGTIEDFGRLTDKYLEIGKLAYLTAIQTQHYSVLGGK